MEKMKGEISDESIIQIVQVNCISFIWEYFNGIDVGELSIANAATVFKN